MKHQASNFIEFKEQLLNRVALLRINGSVSENVNAVNEVLGILDTLHRVSKLAQWEDDEVRRQSDWLIEQLIWCTRSMMVLMDTPQINPEQDGGSRPDVVSIVVLQRGFVEAFLMYNHLFCTSDDLEEKKFRVNAWLYSGVLLRRRHLSSLVEYSARRAYDDKLQQKLRTRLLESPYMATLSDAQRHMLLDQGDARLSKSWEDILREVRVADHVLMAMGFSLLSVFEHPDTVELMELSTGFARRELAIERLRRVCMEIKLYIAYLVKQMKEQHEDLRTVYDEMGVDQRYMVAFYSGLPD